MIVTYKLTCNDGVYRCNDVDITVEEWIRALYAIQENSFKCLVMLFYMPNHECTCYDAGKKYGLHPSSFIAPVTSIAKKAMDIASRFEVEDFDNNANKRYWIVPMQEGYETQKGFVWKMRDELVEAIRSVLLDKLVVFYKEQHKKNRLVVMRKDINGNWFMIARTEMHLRYWGCLPIRTTITFFTILIFPRFSTLRKISLKTFPKL